ncbi:hypothetical protein MG293_006931 [Ovis ammon polii]|uniref:Uncharacterized protein n=1 Tax=Ovis ammon polii TaxID=230172 RepID=A0AAD4UEW4_OVIAM|nr:hypothetical protein MG293_006931 [Ovis ammon polii]
MPLFGIVDKSSFGSSHLSCGRDRPLSSSCWWETLLYCGVQQAEPFRSCVCVRARVRACVLGPSYAIIWNCRQKQLWILPCLSCDRDRPLSSSCWWETLLYSGVSPFLLSAWLILGCGTSYQH